jgi:hypothetical protein
LLLLLSMPQYCAFSNTTAIVMVYDNCKDCSTNQLNLNAQVFDKLAPLDLGNMPIMYRQVGGLEIP